MYLFNFFLSFFFFFFLSSSSLLLSLLTLKQAHIAFLSNNELASPYDDYETHTRSTNTSLRCHWHGADDPTLTKFQYRFLHESRPLGQWSPLPAYKSSAVLELSLIHI